MNLLFIGNSITKHGKCSYWPGEWGMAASSPENDYVHLLVNKLRKSGQHVEYADINFSKWEIMDHDRDEVLPILDDLLDKSYDYIIVQLGENIFSVANLEGDFRSLLTYLQKSCLKKNILVCSSFFQKDDVDNIKRNVCFRGGEQYVSFEDIRCIAPYIAGDNIEIKLDNKIFHINHAGVAIHPGDRGMEIYADRLFEAITHKKNEIKYDGSKNVKPDSNKILFIIQKENEDNYAACIKSIQELEMPPGMTSEILSWTQNDANVNCSQLYNSIAKGNDAKYKVYLPDTTCFVYEKALLDMMKIFASDYEIGMLGVCGAKSLPISGQWQESDTKVGSKYILQDDGSVLEEKYSAPSDVCENVQCISQIMLATQYDIYWHELADTDCYATAHSFEFRRQGYKVVVPQQKITWCLSMVHEATSLSSRENMLYEYAPYLQSKNLTMVNASLLRNCGSQVVVGNNCKLVNPDKIWLGDHVRIGDNCRMAAAYNISIEHNTVIEDSVNISDEQVLPVNTLAVFGSAFEQKKGGNLVIGHNSYIETNVTIIGDVKIGCGCLIKASSMLNKDVPNHCVVAGNPAQIIKAMDYDNGKWIDIKDDVELQRLLDKRKNTQPILSIGIPTFNRSYYLNKCLKAIYKQIGHDDLVEVFVSDNASSDNTPQIAANYQMYSSFKYNRNNINVGPSRNFEIVWEKSHGKYAVAVGDDDYFDGNAIYNAIACLYANPKISILSMVPNSDNKYGVYHGKGIDDFVDRISYLSTYISGIIIKREFFLQLDNRLKFGDTELNQVYIQLEILKKHPIFDVLYGQIFDIESGEYGFGRKYFLDQKQGLAKVFIGQYFDILSSFLTEKSNGLSKETLKKDKRNVMEKFFLPWCNIVTSSDCVWRIDDNVMDVIKKYYSTEPYFEEIKNIINKFEDKQKNMIGSITDKK